MHREAPANQPVGGMWCGYVHGLTVTAQTQIPECGTAVFFTFAPHRLNRSTAR
jgi:hypothetical protein